MIKFDGDDYIFLRENLKSFNENNVHELLENYSLAFQMYIIHYLECKKIAEQIEDGEQVNNFSSAYTIKQMLQAHKFAIFFKSKLSKKDSNVEVINLEELNYKGIVILHGQLQSDLELAKKSISKLIKDFKINNTFIDFEISCYLKILLQ